jgi:hypothetical protein
VPQQLLHSNSLAIKNYSKKGKWMKKQAEDASVHNARVPFSAKHTKVLQR